VINNICLEPHFNVTSLGPSCNDISSQQLWHPWCKWSNDQQRRDDKE